MRRGLAAGGAALAFVVPLVGCEPERDPRHTLAIVDVTLSGLDPSARLDEQGLQVSLRDLDALEPGDVLTVVVFASELTNACEPITIDYAEQGNSEEQDALLESIRSSLPEAYETYISCVRDEGVGGSPAKGSPIFGALVESMVHAEATMSVTEIQLISDGCSYLEGVPVCARSMTSPDYAAKTIEQMPPALKPSLDGIPLVVAGLGRGTGMSSQQVSVLREVFRQYATATGTTVEFE